mmetsp:Transcript_43955/g.73206  ORF Transcript_43955/g.73206 Transcript_43955/m.73206 type:complete len:159 (-) Transcript_43955:291-767(-)
MRSAANRAQGQGSPWENWTDPDFSIANQAQFVPNSVFVFASCFTSWHAVPRIKKQFTRDTIQAFIHSPRSLKDVKKQKCPAPAASDAGASSQLEEVPASESAPAMASTKGAPDPGKAATPTATATKRATTEKAISAPEKVDKKQEAASAAAEEALAAT